MTIEGLHIIAIDLRRGQKFPLGQIVITRNALEAIPPDEAPQITTLSFASIATLFATSLWPAKSMATVPPVPNVRSGVPSGFFAAPEYLGSFGDYRKRQTPE